VGIYIYLTATRQIPPKTPAHDRPTIVDVQPAEKTSEAVTVTAMGTVIPAKTVTVYPEAAGRIIHTSPRLVPGGRFKKGQILVRIDPRDYDLAIKQQQARVAQAEMELARERGLKSVAEREWNMIRDEVQPTAEGKKLALREIQFESAKAALDSAKSTLEQARLMRERTVITAPFDAVVTEEFVDRGQVVSNASHIATLVASDKFWVRVSIPVDRLNWIQIPGVNAEEGSPVKVTQHVGENLRIERDGRVARLLGNLDPKGKMARLIIDVDDPLGSVKYNGHSMPLLLDAYVSVQISGLRVENAIVLPRKAMRDKSRVWVKTEDGKLSIKKVKVEWSKNDNVFVRGDIEAGEKVVTSRIATPVEGMKLREIGEEPAADPKNPGSKGNAEKP